MTRAAICLLLGTSLLALTGCPSDDPDPIGKLETQTTSEELFQDPNAPPSAGAGEAPNDPVAEGETLTDDSIPELDAVQIDPDTGEAVDPEPDPQEDPDEPWDGSQVRGEDDPLEERGPQEPAPEPALSPEELKALAAKGILKHFPGLTVYTKEKRIEVKASICLKRGPALELLACTRKGKTHESLLLLELDPADGPKHLATALILIGLEPTPQVNEFGESVELKKGQKVKVEVSWAAEETPALDSSAPAAIDGRVTRRAEDLIWDKRRGAAMPRVGWVFTGSRNVMVPKPPDFKTEMEVFAASYTGNIAATFHDPDCVLDTPLLEGGDDTVYVPYEARIPERGTACVVHLTPLEEQPADEQPADEAEEGKK